VKDDSPPVLKAKEPDALSQAIQSIKREKRLTKYFVCLGNLSLTLCERVASYATSGSLSRHFLRKHVSRLQGGVHIDCQICGLRLEDRVQLLIHAERFHGTVSRGPAKRLIT
jgi:transcription elongation factor Elf1